MHLCTAKINLIYNPPFLLSLSLFSLIPCDLTGLKGLVIGYFASTVDEVLPEDDDPLYFLFFDDGGGASSVLRAIKIIMMRNFIIKYIFYFLLHLDPPLLLSSFSSSLSSQATLKGKGQ